MILAQSLGLPAGLAAWIGCAAFILMALHYGLNLVDRVKGKPPAEQLAITEAELRQRVERIETVRESDIQEARQSRTKIYEHIDIIRKELKSDIKDVSTQLTDLPVQIIATLRNTKGLL